MAPNRRTLLCAGVGVTAALASRPTGTTAATQADPCEASSISGELSCDADDRAAAADDFGNIIHRQPRAVLKPRSSADVAALMRWSAKQGLKVAARGQGHSTYGRPLLQDGVVIDTSSLSAIHRIDSDRIVVDAGATWRNVFETTLEQMLTPPVLTNYLGLSVGGTLSVGGIGGASSRYGMQADQVLELDVVTGDGRELTCSPRANPDLFDAMRGGLAQCGIITRATLRLVRAPERVRRFQIPYQDLRSLTADQHRVLTENRFHQLQGAIVPDEAHGWRYQLEGAVYYDRDASPDDKSLLASLSDNAGAPVVTDLTYHDDALAFDNLEALLRSKGLWLTPQPWLFTFLRSGNAEHVAGEIIRGLTGDDVGPFGRITFYPMLTQAFGSPLVRLPDENVAFPFNVVRIGAGSDAKKTKQMLAQNRKLYGQIRAEGGVQYPVGAFPMAREDWKDHFGPKWPLLLEAKRRYDPDNLLTPGYNLF